MPDIENRNISIVGVARIEKHENMPQKCPPPDTKPLAPTVYPLQGVKWIKILKTKKNCGENIIYPPLRPEKYAESIGEIRS